MEDDHTRLKNRARRLRRGMTDAERRLWYHLRRRRLGVRVHRQRILAGYIVDFYAPAARLVIEVDGGQHFTGEGVAYDRQRTLALEALGLTVLRFDNLEVLKQTDSVLEVIIRTLQARGFSPSSS